MCLILKLDTVYLLAISAISIHPLVPASSFGGAACRAAEFTAKGFAVLLALHSALYTTLLILCGGLTVWALIFLARGQSVDGAFRSTYVLTMAATVAQALVGVLMFVDEGRPASDFHYLYGISLMVFTGAGYIFGTRADGRREPLILGVAAAASVGLILRAAATAHG